MDATSDGVIVNRPSAARSTTAIEPASIAIHNGKLPCARSATGALGMIKVLGGLVAAIMIAAGGFFGFQFYTQHRIESELDAALEQIRAAGGKASHGKVSFDLLSRTVTIADLTAQSAAQPPVSIKISNVTASGVNQPDTG